MKLAFKLIKTYFIILIFGTILVAIGLLLFIPIEKHFLSKPPTQYSKMLDDYSTETTETTPEDELIEDDSDVLEDEDSTNSPSSPSSPSSSSSSLPPADNTESPSETNLYPQYIHVSKLNEVSVHISSDYLIMPTMQEANNFCSWYISVDKSQFPSAGLSTAYLYQEYKKAGY